MAIGDNKGSWILGGNARLTYEAGESLVYEDRVNISPSNTVVKSENGSYQVMFPRSVEAGDTVEIVEVIESGGGGNEGPISYSSLTDKPLIIGENYRAYDETADVVFSENDLFVAHNYAGTESVVLPDPTAKAGRQVFFATNSLDGSFNVTDSEGTSIDFDETQNIAVWQSKEVYSYVSNGVAWKQYTPPEATATEVNKIFSSGDGLITTSSDDAQSSGGLSNFDDIQIRSESQGSQGYMGFYPSNWRIGSGIRIVRAQYSRDSATSTKNFASTRWLDVNMNSTGQTVDLSTSVYQGYLVCVTKVGGEKFNITCSGEIIGYPDGLPMIDDGDSATLLQISQDEYILYATTKGCYDKADDGSWVKYMDGSMVVKTTDSVNITAYTAKGSMFTNDQTIAYPETFDSIETVHAEIESADHFANVYSSNTIIFTTAIWTHDDSLTGNYDVVYTAKGYWR